MLDVVERAKSSDWRLKRRNKTIIGPVLSSGQVQYESQWQQSNSIIGVGRGITRVRGTAYKSDATEVSTDAEKQTRLKAIAYRINKPTVDFK